MKSPWCPPPPSTPPMPSAICEKVINWFPLPQQEPKERQLVKKVKHLVWWWSKNIGLSSPFFPTILTQTTPLPNVTMRMHVQYCIRLSLHLPWTSRSTIRSARTYGQASWYGAYGRGVDGTCGRARRTGRHGDETCFRTTRGREPWGESRQQGGEILD